jgi:hypothetical protein
MTAVAALRCHDAVWRWVGKLAPAGDQHELTFVFILPPEVTQTIECTLAAGLGLTKLEPPNVGHAIWRECGSLGELLDRMTQTPPMDLLPLRARQRADSKYATLAKLRTTAAVGDAVAIREAVREVREAFSSNEYLLDVFCRTPSHRHGNLVRGWLRKVETAGDVREDWKEEGKQLASWLVDEHAP